ncbi:putative E3 ubiquitin-protein ligase RF298 [Gossypium hirsutum]|uniref:E3 ubiquitin-protein ligase RF298 n=1 Tax=Gossypium hirsutum TaxID=3635 RepID=A0A1U8K1B1_GOSHI|nr:putative E3 ubiquitin-protein ligase RF298 [Gossypium hirsutum]
MYYRSRRDNSRIINGSKSVVCTTNTALASSSSSSENKHVPKSEGRISKSSKTPDHGVEKKPTPKAKGITCISSRSIDYFAGILYEKSLGKYIPQDETDKLILKLVPRLQELQNELHSWTQWTNQKVKQAICRLSKDQDEIKSLRQEKEEAGQFKMEKKIMGESTMKRLSEIEFSLNNTTNQVQDANSKGQKLEAAASASSCQEALERERKALKDVQSWDTQRSLYQRSRKQLSCKGKWARLKDPTIKLRNNEILQMLWKRERMTMEKFLAQAASIRKERECLEAAGKLCFEETDVASGQCSSINERNQIPVFSKGVVDINDYPGSGGLKWERECVMCLSKEKIVVFLPCVHQTEPQMNAAEPCDNSSCMHHKCSDKIFSFGLLQLPAAGQDMVTN